MDLNDEILNDLFKNDTYTTLPAFLDRFDVLFTNEIGIKHVNAVDIDVDFMNEISTIPRSEATLDFGKTLRELKCVILDSRGRQHKVCVQYVGLMDLRISEASVPWGIQNLVCRSLNEAINMFKRQVRSLENYLNVLDRIQEFCTVLEPVSPTYKDGKRIIALIENIWLSLEVSPDGSVRDLRLVGQYRQQNRQLEDMLKAWDHDADVVANVRKIINSLSGDVALAGTPAPVPNQVPMKVPDCAICFYPEFPGDNKVPRPCKNPKCGVYFHENCLYGSLTASRQFGVAFGLCPTCSVPVSCYKADN